MSSARLIPRFDIPYSAADFTRALAALATSATAAPEQMKGVLGDRRLIWTGSGRQALWLILRALDLPKASGVAVPLYCSSSVALTVKAAGFEPVFVDVDKTTLTMDPRSLASVRHRISAVVVAHLFGHAAAMEDLLAAAGGLPVIEDAAQAMLSYRSGRLAGTFGVASFYSFASSKYLPAGGGGIAAINDPRLGELADGLARPSRISQFQRIAMQAAKALLFKRPLYGLLASRLREQAESHTLLGANLDELAIAPASAAVAVAQANSGFRARVEKQRANARHLIGLLGDIEDIQLPIEPCDSRYNYHLFPVLAASREEREAVMQSMLVQGIDTSRVHHSSIEIARKSGYRGGCPVSESVAGRMLTLPVSANLSVADVNRVAAAFRLAILRYREASPRVEQLMGACV